MWWGADRRLAEDGRIAWTAACAAPVLCGAIIGAVAGSPAVFAADWTITGSVSERIEADTNRDLEGDPDPVFGSSTSVGLNVTAATPTTEWGILTGVTGAVFAGSGDTEGLTRVDPNFATEVAHDGKYLDTGARFAFDMQPVSVAQVEETGITEGDATQITAQFSADAGYAVDPRNRLSLAAYSRIVRFTGGTTTLEPITTYGGRLGWIRDLGETTQASLTSGVRRFTSDSTEDPESLTFDIASGVSHTINQRLSFDGNLGVSMTRTTQTIAGQRDTDFSIGALADLGVAWRPEPDTELSFAFSHGLEPSTLGVLQTTTSLGVGLEHAINERVSAGVAVALQRRESGGGFDAGTDRDFISIAPSLAFQLTPDWVLQTGYALTADRESGDEAVSNRVFLTVTREFTILP